MDDSHKISFEKMVATAAENVNRKKETGGSK